ncbi:MAG: response regulator [Acidobacteria bacterium]|nr:response regulator [Acidobacteriota bacterium]
MSRETEPQRILIIEDEEDVVQPVAFRLEMHGFEVLMEPDGELGFQTATAELPDLILLDVMMPGIDGLTLCRILKEREDTGQIPIIIFTARTTMGDVEKAFAARADDYIAKPFEWDELLGKVNRCLARKQPLASRAG